MSAETITTRRFRCDHIGLREENYKPCNKTEDFRDDDWAGKAGWGLGEINGKKFALCKDHYSNFRNQTNFHNS